MKKLLSVIALAFLSLMISFIALGLSYKSYITPTTSLGEFYRIHGDSWLEDGAKIELYNLTKRGNQLIINFGNWHPEQLPPPQLELSVCGKTAAIFEVKENQRQQVIFLTGDCSPREVHFKVFNPFYAGTNDRRPLGVQLESVRVTSRVGLPLVSFEKVLWVAAALFTLALFFFSLLSFKELKKSLALLLAFLVLAGAGGLLARAESLNLFNHYHLWLLVTLVLAGALVARYLPSAQSEVFKRPGLWSFAIIVAAAVIRIYGIDFGMPGTFHPDEAAKVRVLTRMWDTSSLNPQYFLHPSLLLYLTYFLNSSIYYLGFGGEHWSETALLSGRLVSCLAGIFSVYATYLIGRRLFDTFSGLLASAALAFFPLHVTCSRYLKEDSLLLALTLACCLVMLKAVYENKKSYLLWAGLLAGVSASAKYSGLLSVFIVMSAPWLKSKTLRPDWSFFIYSVLGLIIAPLGFILFTPYSLLDTERFLAGVRYEKQHMLGGHSVAIDAWSQLWMYHFSRSVIPGSSLFSTIVACLGVGLILAKRKIEGYFVLCLLIMFYLPAEWVRAKPAPQPERYIFPCLPFLALAGAWMIRHSASRSYALALVLSVLFVAFPAVRTFQLASEVRDETRVKMADWMKQNIPPGTAILVDWWPYAPQFKEPVFKITQMDRADIFSNFELKFLKESEKEYLLLSSLFYERFFIQPGAPEAARKRVRQAFERVPVVKEFSARHGTYGFHNPRITLFSLREKDFIAFEEERELKKAGKIKETRNDRLSSFPHLLERRDSWQ